ncbi:hypothetical protein KY349_02395 [Candidatus Woesearchaeota archaeon]|nr:hypothetical protein [Candidatus Woesearchaeota archaeon]
MEDFDYFHFVEDPGRVIGYIERILEQNPVIIDTNVVPTLESYLQRKKPEPAMVHKYSEFMAAFNRWLDDSKNLVIVPQVARELEYRLHKAEEAAKAKNGKNGKPGLEKYIALVHQAREKLFVDRCEEKKGYDEMLELLIYLHDPMNWQKEDHEAGNADDQIVVTAMTYAINEVQTVTVFSNDVALNKTLLCFHKLLSSKGIVPSEKLPVVQVLRELSILLNQFDSTEGLFQHAGSTLDFELPYKYDFKDDMRLYFRRGSELGARSSTAAKRKIVEKTQTFLHKYNSLLSAPRGGRSRMIKQPEPETAPEEPAAEEETQEKTALGRELEKLAAQKRETEEEELTAEETPTLEQAVVVSRPSILEALPEVEDIEVEKPELQDQLEHLLSRFNYDISSPEDLERAQRDFGAWQQIVENLDAPDVLAQISVKQAKLAAMHEVYLAIEEKKQELSEASSRVGDAETAKQIAELGNNIAMLYGRLEQLKKQENSED